MLLRRWAMALALPFFALEAAPIPRHLFQSGGPLTASNPRAPREIGDEFTAAQMEAPGLYLANEYKTDHNGVTHLVYRQRFQGIDIHHAEWRVNIDRDGRVINAGGQLYKAPTAPPPNGARLMESARAALTAVSPILAGEARLRRAGMTARGDARFLADDMGQLIGRPVWYPIRGVLQPAWNFVVTDGDGVTTYDTVIDAASESVLAKQPITMFQTAPRGSVFTGISPQPPVKIGVQSTEEPPYAQRVVVPFTGSATASPKGWVTGTETAGNNTITGLNPTGATFLANPVTAKSPTLDFQFPLLLGPDAPVSTNFADAVTTNLFYWVNRAHDLFYEIGFNEAAGNFQTQNLTGAGVGGDPMLAYAQFGTQALTGTAALNNAFFTVRDYGDGAQAMIAMYLTSNNGIWADGSLASDVIIHEYAHGVAFRLIPTLNSGFQGGAMNEAFSDFWALEFVTPEGAAPDGVYPVSEYWNRAFGVGLRNRPYTTNMEINPLTYADLGRSWASAEIHEDGNIWVEALWEVRANLIRQFGETEGRRRLRRIVIDGMKMSPPAPSMVDMRDAILLAERVDYKGESQTQLWEAFAKRGMGVLAFSPHSDTIQITASFDKPSNTGVIGLQTESPTIGEPLRITVFDGNATNESLTVDVTSSSGDLETVVLVREGSAYSGTLFTSSAGPSRKGDGGLSLIRADQITVYYNDPNTGAGSKLVEKTVGASNNYLPAIDSPAPLTYPNETATGLRVSPGRTYSRAALPFEFPFYGKKYREVRIYSNGYLQFDTALPPPCLDEAGFNNITGIAPMGMWMRTNGFAQPNENVFTSRGPNSYTVRWAGETVSIVDSPPFTPEPEPVNFAVTLYENGEIQFQYGAGNQNLINSTPVAGCQSTTPIVGISRGIGNGAFLHSLGYERATFKDAPSLYFLPPFGNATNPQMRIESPAADAAVSGVLTVRGIIYDEDTLLSAASILIDGVFQGNATLNQNRADICARERLPGCPFIGFVRNIDVKGAKLTPGSHTLQIRAVNAKGGFQDYPESPLSFTVEEGDGPLPTGVIESAKDGDVWKGTLNLRGYAYSKVSRVSNVDVIIDNVVYTRAVYGLGRADICSGEGAGASNCPFIGWQAVINTTLDAPALANGEHRLQIRITEDNGRISYQPETPVTIRVDNVVNLAPIGVVTSPTNLQRVSGIITISGYAWDPDGRVANVFLAINDGQRGAAMRYGLPRPDACATLPDVAACPNIGFETTFDTRTLPNGPASLAAVVQDDLGRFVFVPAITAQGMNIIVDNP